MTAERGSDLDPNLDGIQNELSHPTVDSDTSLVTDLTPDAIVTNGNNSHHIDLSPGSSTYKALVAIGVTPVPVDSSSVLESGQVRLPRQFTEDEIRVVFGRPSREEDRIRDGS